MAFYRQQRLGGLIFLCLLKLISADGHVNIQLEVLQYDNPKGTSFQGTDYTSQRKCCDSGRNASACSTTDTCDTYFVICIGGVGQEGHCSGQSFRTETLRNSNSFTASSDNNLMKLFQWEHWHSGDIGYVVNVMDDDRNKDELIENFTSSKALVVGTTYKNSTLQMLSFSNFVSVDLGIRIWCQDSYGGPDCSYKCTNNTYSVCTHMGGSVLLPSCLDADVSRLEINGLLTVKAKDIQLLLIEFILQNICPEAHSVNVDIVHFRLTGSVEFKAKCNNTAVSSLVFTTNMFVLSLTNKASLATYFPHIPLQTPSVIRKPGTGAHKYMILRILSYKDLSSSCHHQDCNIQISICVQGRQNSCLYVSSKLSAAEMRICNGDIVDRLSTHQERSTTTLVPLTSWPILSVNVKYNNVLKWKRSNNVLHSYIAEALYSESKSHRMTIESFDRNQTTIHVSNYGLQ